MPTLGTSGEADVIDAGMARQRVADLVAVACHDVDGARRKSDVGRQLGHAQQRQAGIFGRLHHADVAGGQGAADAAAEDLHRVIPRNDVSGHAVRLAPREHAVAVQIGQGLTRQLVAGAGIELEVAHQRQRIGLGLLGRFAAVALLQRRQLFHVLCNLVRQAHQQSAALSRADLGPDLLVAVARRTDGLCDVFGCAALQFVERLAVRRIDHGNGAARCRALGGIGDEVKLHERYFPPKPGPAQPWGRATNVYWFLCSASQRRDADVSCWLGWKSARRYSRQGR